MITATELLTIRALAIAAKELEEQKKDEEARVFFEEIKENTIHFLENEVSNSLLSKATDPNKKIFFTISGKIREDRLGNKIFIEVDKDGRYYVDGTPSYSTTDKKYSLDIITDICNSAGFLVTIQDWNYKTYWEGEFTGKILTIKT